MTAAQAKRACRQIGLRRAKLQAQMQRLARDTQGTLEAAGGVIPVTMAAELSGLSRSTAYAVYLGGSAGANGNPTSDGAATGKRDQEPTRSRKGRAARSGRREKPGGKAPG